MESLARTRTTDAIAFRMELAKLQAGDTGWEWITSIEVVKISCSATNVSISSTKADIAASTKTAHQDHTGTSVTLSIFLSTSTDIEVLDVEIE